MSRDKIVDSGKSKLGEVVQGMYNKEQKMFNLSVPQQSDTDYDRYLLSAHVDHCLAKGEDVHPDNLKFRTLPEDKENTLSRPLNPKGKPFTWSYTALTDFEGCPARYAAVRFYQTVPFVETEAIIWGNRVHKAGELHVLGQDHNDPEAFKEVKKYAEFFKSLKDKGAEVPVEMEIALTESMKPVKWFSKEAWFRVKLDVPVIQGIKAGIYDYKTGKNVKDDEDQLKICAAALSVVRPEIEEFIPKLIWTRHQTTTGIRGEKILKADVPNIWAGVLGRVKRMEDAWRSENFSAKPSGLCPWCGVYDSCAYARRK